MINVLQTVNLANDNTHFSLVPLLFKAEYLIFDSIVSGKEAISDSIYNMM